jgi:regulator of nucleoside diphosphate kinase
MACVNQYDFDRLKELIAVVRVFGKKEWQESADALDGELTQARITVPQEVPHDVVTMNSRVRIRDVETGAQEVVVLVFPRDLHAHDSHVCILDPLGLALFGRRLGDAFEVGGRQGTTRYLLEDLLYQPEAAGDWHV